MHTYPPMTDYRAVCDGFDWALPESFNFGLDVVDELGKDPDRLALIWCDEAGAEARYTFADMARLSDRFANVLAAHGIEPGDRVVIQLPRIPAWQVAQTGALKLGAVVVPCISMLTGKDLDYRIRHSGAVAVLTTRDNTAKIPADLDLKLRLSVGGPGEAGDGFLDYDTEMAAASDTFDTQRFPLEHPAAIYYTSGTTGNPKGVTHSCRSLYVWRAQSQYWHDLGPGDVMWCTADTGWSKAGTAVIWGPWSNGAAALFYDGGFDPEKRLDLLARYRVTVYCAAATELRQMIYADVAAHDLSALRHTVSAGETLNPEIAGKWAALTGKPVHEGYGQTETLMSIHNYAATEQRAGSAGLPLPGYEIAIVAEGQFLPTGQSGVLAIRLPNPNFMLGYWEEPERTAENIVAIDGADWWLTGDTARIDADGYVYFEGRADDVISSAGYRIGPTEVENALLEHPAVQECAAVASPDPDRGEVVKAFIVLAAGHDPSDDLLREIQDHCKRLTAPYKYPRRIAFVSDLPKNVAGKILRKELKAREFAKTGAPP